MIEHRITPVALLFTCALLAPAASAIEVTVGEQVLEIPAPTGFTATTPEMEALQEYQRAFDVPTIRTLGNFISESDAEIAQDGAIPSLDRWLKVQVLRSIEEGHFTEHEFVGFKTTLRNQMQEMVNHVNRKLPGFLDTVSNKLSGKYEFVAALSMVDMIPLGIHHEEEDHITYSMYSIIEVQQRHGRIVEQRRAVTVSFFLVQDKVLSLYTHGKADDLNWTRQIMTDWIEKIAKANSDAHNE